MFKWAWLKLLCRKAYPVPIFVIDAGVDPRVLLYASVDLFTEGKHVCFRALSVNLGVRDQLQYVFAHESKWILVYVYSVRSVYHIMSNTINKIYNSKQTHLK